MFEKNFVARRDFLRFSALGVGSSLLAACGVPGAGPAASESAAQEPEMDSENMEGVQWGLQYDPHVATYERLAELVHKETGYTTRVEPQGWPLETKLIASMSAGTQPDVICMMGKVAVPLYMQDGLLPLSEDVYSAVGVVPNKAFHDEPIQAYSWEGEIYGVPVEVNAVGSMAHVPTQDVEALGLADLYPPTNGDWIFDSYEHMWELAQALHVEEDGRVVTWGLSSKGWDNQSFLGIVRTLLASDGTDWWDLENQQFNINSEAGVQAMQLFAEIPVQMGIETELDVGHHEAAYAGKIALARGSTGPSMQPGIDAGVSYEMTGAPKVIPGELPLFVGEAGWGFTSPRNATNKDYAVAYLQTLCSHEGQREYSKIYGGSGFPAWKDLNGKYDHFADPDPEGAVVKAAGVMANLGPLTRYYGEGFGYPAEVDQIGGSICSEVRLGNMTAAEAVATYQERCEAQFEGYLKDLADLS
jgi:ABC-type glycerol-3-phosphate transport system substrate-binding protein